MRFSLIALILVCGLIAGKLAFACESCEAAKAETMQIAKADEKQMESAQPALTEVGNTICPISDEKIVPGKEVKITYKGKVYNMCCSMCEKDFKKDPEAAIKKLEAAQAAK